MFDEHPKPEPVKPGRSKNVTVVPRGDLITNDRSPIHEWFTPTVVEVKSELDAVPSNRMAKCVIGPRPDTFTVVSTPVTLLSGMATAGPV